MQIVTENRSFVSVCNVAKRIFLNSGGEVAKWIFFLNSRGEVAKWILKNSGRDAKWIF
jgi:hypothetical protein